MGIKRRPVTCSIKIVGLDLSLNHFGIVCLDFEKNVVDGWGYMTTKRKFFNSIKSSDNVIKYFIQPRSKKTEDKDHFNSRRREEIFECLEDFFIRFGLLFDTLDAYVCTEDYAYHTSSSSSFQFSELFGLIKHYLWISKFKLRLIGPTSLKLWVSSKGNALKKDVMNDMRYLAEQIQFPNLDLLFDGKLFSCNKKAFKDDVDGPATDVIDAFALASILAQELKLRDGNLVLKELSYNQRRVFLHVSKSQPVNLLDTPFICKNTENDR